MKRGLNIRWILLAIALAALVPRIYLGLIQSVAYDGYWHVFTATQDRWANMVLEYKTDAHPILYYLLLRWVARLGPFPIVYRSIGILTGAASVFWIGKIAQKVCTNAVAPVLAAAAYAFAITSIDLSIDVRSYMPCLFFVLLSFNSFLDAVALPGDRRGASARISFSVFASVAIGFEYYALFYLAACLGVVVLEFAFDSAYRSRFLDWAQSKWVLVASAVLIPCLTILYFYRSHLSRLPQTFGHVRGFYWDPSSGESRSEFLFKNLQNTFAYFLPLPIANRAVFLGVLAALLLALAACAWMQRDQMLALRYRAVLLMLVLLLMQLMVLGLERRYPFGGEMRQQSILAPFLCLSLFMLLDQMIALPSSPRLRWAALAVIAFAIAVSAHSQWKSYLRLPQDLFSDDYRDFRAVIGSPQAVYVDQFSLIAYYIHTHDWIWRTSHRQGRSEPTEEFQTQAPTGQIIKVLRDRTAWNFDFANLATYRAIAQLMQDRQRKSIGVFNLHQDSPALPPGTAQENWDRVQGLARQAGLEVTALDVQRFHFFASFARP